MNYDLLKPWLSLDPWQDEVLKCDTNIVLRSGRQVGKSTVVSVLAGRYALNHPNKQVLVVASVERQAYHLFDKILNYIYATKRTQVYAGLKRPTKSKIQLKNGSIIRCLPTGLTGNNLRGYTIDLLICDEAAFIKDEVFTSISPALALTRGRIILLSTPCGREGYFYRAFEDDSFTPFHVSSLDNPRRDDRFLARERERMSKLEFAQEYEGQFIDELMQFFPTELISKVMSLERPSVFRRDLQTYLGCDFARLGRDDSVYSVVQKNRDRIIHIENVVTSKTLTTDSLDTIYSMNLKYDLKHIYIDDGGLGAGILDQLLNNDATRRKTTALNNAKRSIEHGTRRTRAVMKNDMYANLLILMEQGKIQLLSDPEIYKSLRSIQYEYIDYQGGKIMRIFGANDGAHSHIAEALVRAAFCTKEKSLNLWFHAS